MLTYLRDGIILLAEGGGSFTPVGLWNSELFADFYLRIVMGKADHDNLEKQIKATTEVLNVNMN